MKPMKFLAGALSLALLAGCGTTVGADADDLAYQAADLKRDSALVTVDGQPITAEEYLFWLVNAIEQQKALGGLAQDGDWDETLSDGSTAREAVKADALETAKLFRVLITKSAELTGDLSQEDRQKMEEDLTSYIEQQGGQEVFQEQLDRQCVSLEGYKRLNQVTYYYQNLQKVLTEQGELTVTDEDIDAFLEEQGIYAAKHILLFTRHQKEDGSYEEMSQEEKDQVLEEINGLRDQLREAGDSEDLFDQLMNQYSEDGRDDNGDLYAPDGYPYIYPNQMVPEFEEGAKALDIGEISGPVESGYGYHLILREEPDRDQARSECTESYKLYKLTLQWLDEAEVETTKAYDELDPKDFYDRLQAINEARAAAKPTESPEQTESPAP